MNSGSVGGIESCLATHSYPNPNASREFTLGTAQLQNLRFRLVSAPHKPEAPVLKLRVFWFPRPQINRIKDLPTRKILCD